MSAIEKVVLTVYRKDGTVSDMELQGFAEEPEVKTVWLDDGDTWMPVVTGLDATVSFKLRGSELPEGEHALVSVVSR